MSLVKWGFIGLFLLPVVEMAAFVVVALAVGWLPAVCLFLATSFLGLLILRRSGRNDFDRFRDAFRRDGIRAIHLESPGLGPMLGGILLVFPGFITDALGALLLVPAVRRQMRRLIARTRDERRRQSDPSVIDLTPKEWRQVSERQVSEQQVSERQISERQVSERKISEKPAKDGRPSKRVR